MSHQRLDVRRLAADAAEKSGEIAQEQLQRLCSSLPPPLADLPAPPVAWWARGESRAVTGSASQIRLHLRLRTRVTLTCQRCLQRMEEALDVERSFLFVSNEDEAARLDEESDEDVLVLPRQLDLAELIEDELILALPLVPRHAECPQPLDNPAADAEALALARNPFAVLASLRKPPGG
jgi:uncharacterized protein